MNEAQIKKNKLFFELIEYVNELKENSDEIRRYSMDMFERANDQFERQNDKVFNINLYILIRLYKNEYNKIKKENSEFTLKEYYDFIESIDMNDDIREAYIRMPKMLAENKILSYITDTPNFMSMIR